jgi:hypothetical protein
MTPFEKLALRGLWLILNMVMMTGNLRSGTDQIIWAKDVAEALGDDRLRDI